MSTNTKLLTVEEVAAALEVKPRKVYQLVSEGSLKKHPYMRHIRIHPKELERFLNLAI